MKEINNEEEEYDLYPRLEGNMPEGDEFTFTTIKRAILHSYDIIKFQECPYPHEQPCPFRKSLVKNVGQSWEGLADNPQLVCTYFDDYNYDISKFSNSSFLKYMKKWTA